MHVICDGKGEWLRDKKDIMLCFQKVIENGKLRCREAENRRISTAENVLSGMETCLRHTPKRQEEGANK